MGALHARHRFAAIADSNVLIESYPLFASSQHVGATAAVTILLFCFLLFEQKKKFVCEQFDQLEIKLNSFGTNRTDFSFW